MSSPNLVLVIICDEASLNNQLNSSHAHNYLAISFSAATTGQARACPLGWGLFTCCGLGKQKTVKWTNMTWYDSSTATKSMLQFHDKESQLATAGTCTLPTKRIVIEANRHGVNLGVINATADAVCSVYTQIDRRLSILSNNQQKVLPRTSLVWWWLQVCRCLCQCCAQCWMIDGVETMRSLRQPLCCVLNPETQVITLIW